MDGETRRFHSLRGTDGPSYSGLLNSEVCPVQAGVPITRGFPAMGWKLCLGGVFAYAAPPSTFLF
jgi:hypothetical protein